MCRELALTNHGQAASRLDDDEKDDITTNDVTGRLQKMIVINESGLYSLILTSRTEGAKKFKKWITSSVLPTIRKTGGYGDGVRGVPQFTRRYHANSDRVAQGYFSVVSELFVRIWAKFERHGYIM